MKKNQTTEIKQVDYQFTPRRDIKVAELAEILAFLNVVVHGEGALNQLSEKARRHWDEIKHGN